MLATEPKPKATGRGPSVPKSTVPLEIEGRRHVLGGRVARIAAWLTDATREINDVELERIVIVCDAHGDGFRVQLVNAAHYDV